ncbi:hypothetical protein M433DRAFT_99832 [Acidomyces richmondensis BFW]|nr:MAG: hypothetical protein FE78DRAFT_106523 [Acidomyces sp. 'richmondensis']KYG50003.1 hypothetical protein M433DRAFT_99832 [Acidomyces richmondensis BFW]
MARPSESKNPHFQVIACGLPRTGTTSLGEALSVLLKGEVFDGGGESWYGEPTRQFQLLQLAWHCPVRSLVDRTFALHTLARLTENRVASTDLPGCYFVEELLQLYPDAKVICTVREKESWWASYSALWEAIFELRRWAWLSPRLNRYCEFSISMWKRVPQVVEISDREPWPITNQKEIYDAHANYIRKIVPEKKLFYFDVKQGWPPLCEMLDVPIPNIAFPHSFPRAHLDTSKNFVLRRLKMRLALIIGVATLLAGGFGYWSWIRLIGLIRRSNIATSHKMRLK